MSYNSIMPDAVLTWCKCRTVGQLRAALMDWRDDAEIVDMDSEPVVVRVLPPEPESDRHPAAPAYLEIGGLPIVGEEEGRVEPSDGAMRPPTPPIAPPLTTRDWPEGVEAGHV